MSALCFFAHIFWSSELPGRVILRIKCTLYIIPLQLCHTVYYPLEVILLAREEDTIKGETLSNIRGHSELMEAKDREKWRAIVQDRSFLATTTVVVQED